MASQRSDREVPPGSGHLPVMLREAVDLLQVRPGGVYCDGTAGGGGHAAGILEGSGPGGRLLALDRDPEAIRRCERTLEPFGERVTLIQASFADLPALAARLELPPLDGILLDLGCSSHQLDSPERGFSFRHDGPLDMRMDPAQPTTAAGLLAGASEADLARILGRLGEVPRPRRLARGILAARDRGEIRGTADLARVVSRLAGGRGPRSGRIHPGTLTFQALRMAVNDELGALERFLEGFVPTLRPGGRVVIISFHSLEDRAVKRAFARLRDPCTCPPGLPVCACGLRPEVRVLTRKPLRPTAEESAANPRARSARMRAAQKLEPET